MGACSAGSRRYRRDHADDTRTIVRAPDFLGNGSCSPPAGKQLGELGEELEKPLQQEAA